MRDNLHEVPFDLIFLVQNSEQQMYRYVHDYPNGNLPTDWFVQMLGFQYVTDRQRFCEELCYQEPPRNSKDNNNQHFEKKTNARVLGCQSVRNFFYFLFFIYSATSELQPTSASSNPKS